MLYFLCTLSANAQDKVVTGPKRKTQTTTSKPIKKAKTKQTTTGSINGHEWVDLGLPSGTLWATCNVGASKCQNYGELYSLVFKSSCLIKTSDDIAYIQWGNKWCLPSEAQLRELKSHCRFSWETYKGVWGYIVKGPNGNSIFFPAAGWSSSEEGIKQRNEYGSYWSGDLPSSSTPEYRYFLSFDKDGVNIESDYCNIKQSIRPVVCK